MNDLSQIRTLFTNSEVSLIVKIIILFLIGLYDIFVLIVFSHIRSFKRILIINQTEGSPLIQTAAVIYLIVAFSLFLVALAIL